MDARVATIGGALGDARPRRGRGATEDEDGGRGAMADARPHRRARCEGRWATAPTAGMRTATATGMVAQGGVTCRHQTRTCRSDGGDLTRANVYRWDCSSFATAVQSDGTTRADKIAIPDPDCFSFQSSLELATILAIPNNNFRFLKISWEGGETSVVDAPSPSSKYTSRAPNARPTGDAKTPPVPLLKSNRTSSLTARARALSISAVSGAIPNRGQRFFEEAAFFFWFPGKKTRCLARRSSGARRPSRDSAGPTPPAFVPNMRSPSSIADPAPAGASW